MGGGLQRVGGWEGGDTLVSGHAQQIFFCLGFSASASGMVSLRGRVRSVPGLRG